MKNQEPDITAESLIDDTEPLFTGFRIVRITVPAGETPERLDQYLSRMIANTSRSKVREGLDAGLVQINNKVEQRPAYKIKGGDEIELHIPATKRHEALAENLPLDIIFEDDDIIIINKAAGMVVHPAPGTPNGTLLNALLHHMDVPATTGATPSEMDRAGIVHRLDKDTSGLLVVAKNEYSHRKLAKQFFDHTAHRLYEAIVWGVPKKRFDKIESNIGRHPKDRKRFTILSEGGKLAITEYIMLEEFSGFSLLELKLQTGRTHQIRVHLQHLGYPVFGDPTYGGRAMHVKRTDIAHFKQWVDNMLGDFPRQALHAKTLRLTHPRSGELMEWSVELPDDMQLLIKEMRKMEGE